MSKTVQLLEYASTDRLTADADAGVIRGVKVLGLQSANGRRYLREAVGNAAKLYEGKVVNLDHPSKPGEQTSSTRRLGWLESVKQGDDGGLYADLHFLKKHPFAPVLIETAQRRPQLLGLSHNAHGRERQGGGREAVIEAIESVTSVDLVADPATVNSLFESRHMPSTLKAVAESLTTKRPRYAKALREMAEAGLMSPDATMDAPGDDAGDSDHEQALYDAAKAVIDDDSMDVADKVAKIRKILAIVESGGEGGGESDTTPDVTAATEESRKLKLENTSLRLLMEAGLKPTKTLSKALSACKDEAEMKDLITEARSGSQRPRSAAGIVPAATGGNGKAITEAKVPGPEADGKTIGRWLTTAGN